MNERESESPVERGVEYLEIEGRRFGYIDCTHSPHIGNYPVYLSEPFRGVNIFAQTVQDLREALEIALSFDRSEHGGQINNWMPRDVIKNLRKAGISGIRLRINLRVEGTIWLRIGSRSPFNRKNGF